MTFSDPIPTVSLTVSQLFPSGVRGNREPTVSLFPSHYVEGNSRRARPIVSLTVSRDPILCPECRAGKHGNCDGNAWDFDKDSPAHCECRSRQHMRQQ